MSGAFEASGPARDELLRLSIEAAPTGIAMFDRGMRYIAASRRYREDLGIAEIDPIGRSHYDIFPEIPERWRAIHRRCLAGAAESCEEDPFPRADGALEWYRWEIRPWHEPDGAIGGVVLFSQNITREVKERTALRRWAEMFENAAIGIATSRPDREAIEFANPAHAALHGMSVAEMQGRAFADVYPPEELPRFRDMLAVADRSGHVAFESFHRRKDGTTFPVQVDLASIRDGEGKVRYRVATLLDITERRRADDARRAGEALAHEQRNRALLLARVAELVLADGEPETMVRHLYRLVAEHLGLAVYFHYRADADGALVLTSYGGVGDAEARAGARIARGERICGRVAQTGVAEYVTGILASTDERLAPVRGLGIDSYFCAPLLAGGRLLGTLGFGRRSGPGFSEADLTFLRTVCHYVAIAMLRRAAELASLESRARLQAVMDNSVDGLITIDERGTVSSFSRPAERMFGFTAAEVLGNNVKMLMPEPDRSGHDGYLAAYLATGERHVIGAGRQVHGRRRDGTIFPMDLAVGELPNIGGPREFVGSVRDITDRVDTEAQLRQAQKMEAIGQLTGGMAHDFNNLLGVITGNLELAAAKLPSGDRVRARIESAIAAAWRGAELTRRLLAFARRQPLQPQRVAPNDIIAKTAKLLHRTLGEAVEIALELSADLWPTLVDPVQLEASLVNLATNARDAMPSGGRLVIATGNRHLDPVYAASHVGVAPGDYVMISVTDTGTGMAPEVLARVFEPFFTTKEVGRGTGLGLSMVFGFMKQSGGHVAAYSEPGAGTTFRLYLPRVVGAGDVEALAPPVASPGRGERVLVVEDNAALRRVGVDQLTDLGYRVLQAERAAVALEILARETVDLLLTDIVMPGGMDGFELARQVRMRWPAVKVVLTSGFPETRIAGAPGGAGRSEPVLSKPYAREDLARALRAALDGATGAAGSG